jgi:hypothetical protein
MFIDLVNPEKFNCHFNNEEKAIACPKASIALVEDYLTKEQRTFTLEECYDPFFELTDGQQKKARALDRLTKKNYKNSPKLFAKYDFFQELLKGYNVTWHTSLTVSNFADHKLDALPDSLKDDKQKKHFRSLLVDYNKLESLNQEDKKLKEQIKECEKSTTKTKEEKLNELKNIEDQVVVELNKKHAAICLDQFYILTEKENPIFGGKDFSLESKQSFINQYENKTVEMPNGKAKTKSDIWLKSPNRREYKGIVFDPTSQGNVNGYFNLWMGFNKRSHSGDCSLYWKHIKENVCSNDPESYRFFRKWTSNVFQKPDEVHTSIILCGGQGVGKNSAVEPLGALLGSHYVLLSNISELVSNFNYHLKHAVLIHANEALWGGNRKEIGTLKAQITEKTCLIEGKGKDRIMVKNFKHVILSSNEDWPVHLDADDRRFFVLRVSEAHKDDHAYFAAIQDQLDNGGYEALLHDLLNEDLTNFNPRRFPNSNEAFWIKIRSADSTHKYIYQVLNEGCFDVGNTSPSGDWHTEISTETVFSDYCTWCTRNGEKHISKDLFSRNLRKVMPSITDRRPGTKPRIRLFVFPSLEIARIDFEKAYKATPIIWSLTQ